MTEHGDLIAQARELESDPNANACRKQEPVTEAEVEAAARAAWAHRWPLDERAEDIWRAMSEDARESAMRAGRAALEAARAVPASNGETP